MKQQQKPQVNVLQLIVAFVVITVALSCCQNSKVPNPESYIHGSYEAQLTDAPKVPVSPNYGYPMKVMVHLHIIEKVMRLADGTTYDFWTFGGHVPGKFIRIRQGDKVEFYLSNDPKDKMPHNIDMHAVSGPGGGSDASMTSPGHTSKFSFTALNPGLYVYHCATAPVGIHIANGMYGLIYVEPKKDLPPVDKEFYIMQGEVYTKGNYGDTGLQAFDMAKALNEEPDYVVFNGSVGSTTGNHALHAKVGETIRMFVGNGGPNLISAFHIIGVIFDSVRMGIGGPISRNIQTVLIPPGGAAIVEFTCKVPGTYTIVDHSAFCILKGAMAQLIVTGPEDSTIYSGKQADMIYTPSANKPAQASTQPTVAEIIGERTLQERLQLGGERFHNTCAACHMNNAEGIPGTYPPLAGSNFLMHRKDKGIGIVMDGLHGKITVNGKKFNNTMPNLGLSDDEIANVLTYVRSNFGNHGGLITLKEVQAIRKKVDGGKKK